MTRWNCLIPVAILLLGMAFSTCAAAHPLLEQAAAEKDVAKAAILYWQYVEKFPSDPDYTQAATDFAYLLSDHERNADLARLGATLIEKQSPPAEPMNVIAYSLAEADTALGLALACARVAVGAQRKAALEPPPPERSQKAWNERQNRILGGYLDTAGFVFLKQGDAKKALELFTEADSLTLADPDIHKHLAQAQQRQGNPEAALGWALSALNGGLKDDEELQGLIRESYVKIKGSDSGLQEYIAQRLQDLHEHEMQVMISEKLDRPAPDFDLLALAGGRAQLAQYRGKVVIVDFWATWCGPCRQELPLLQAAYPDWQQQGVELLAISTDKDTVKVAPFIQDNQYTFPVLFDQGAARAYDVSGIPTLFLIDPQGKIQYQHVGYRPDIVEILNLQIAELKKP